VPDLKRAKMEFLQRGQVPAVLELFNDVVLAIEQKEGGRKLERSAKFSIEFLGDIDKNDNLYANTVKSSFVRFLHGESVNQIDELIKKFTVEIHGDRTNDSYVEFGISVFPDNTFGYSFGGAYNYSDRATKKTLDKTNLEVFAEDLVSVVTNRKYMYIISPGPYLDLSGP